MKLPSAFLNIFFILLVVPPALADGYADARAELVAAYQAQDFDAMVDAAGKSLQVRPGYPGALFNLALAQALSGNPKASFATLNSLLDRGVDFGADEMDEFAALRELPQWDAYRTAVETLYVPVGAAEVALQLDIDRFVPEGIAFDSDGVAYLGSIHKGQ
jgi:hypothetical protein